MEYIQIKDSQYPIRSIIKNHIWQKVNKSIFRLFPNRFRSYRNFLLRLFGAKLDNDVSINKLAIIDYPWNLEMGHLSSLAEGSWAYCLDKITIGEKCCIGKNVFLITGTHDINKHSFDLITKPIVVENGCWISTGAYILPNVNLGQYAVVGAGAVVSKNVQPWTVVAGNPAKFVKNRNKF